MTRSPMSRPGPARGTIPGPRRTLGTAARPPREGRGPIITISGYRRDDAGHSIGVKYPPKGPKPKNDYSENRQHRFVLPYCLACAITLPKGLQIYLQCQQPYQPMLVESERGSNMVLCTQWDQTGSAGGRTSAQKEFLLRLRSSKLTVLSYKTTDSSR